MTIFMSQHSHRSVPCARLKRCPQNTTLGSAYELEMPVNTARLLFTENPISAYVQSLHHCSVAQTGLGVPADCCASSKALDRSGYLPNTVPFAVAI